MVEKGSAAVFSRSEFLHKLRKESRVIHVDLCDFRYFLCIVLVMRDTVVLFGHADLRVRSLAEFARHHKCKYPCDVGLPGRSDKIEHQANMLIKRIRHTDRGIEGNSIRPIPAFRLLDPALDFADIVEIVRNAYAVPRAEAALEAAGFFRNRIQNASLHLETLRTFAGGSCFAE